MADFTTKGKYILNTMGAPLDALDRVWVDESAFVAFVKSVGMNTIPAGTRIRTYYNGKYAERFWNGTVWKEVLEDVKSDIATAQTTATQAKNEAHDASVTALDAQGKATANAAAINAVKTELAGDIDEIGTAIATVTNVTIPGINKTISDNAITAAAAAAEAKSSADAAQTTANGNKNNISANAAAIAEHKSKLDTLKPIDQEDFDVSYNDNGASVSARGKKLFDIAAVDNVDAGLMTPAILEHINQLTNLQGAKFIGIYINEDSGDAVDEAKAYYSSHCESGEVVWFLFGGDITRLYVGSWDGTTYHDLDDDKSYDFTDFSGVKAALDELVPKVYELKEEIDYSGINGSKNVSDCDLQFEDDKMNVIVKFSGGHIKTKEFDSKNTLTEKDFDNADFAVSDEHGNCLFMIQDGFPRTKNFNGKDYSKDKQKTILCVGDSLTQGGSATKDYKGDNFPNGDYPSLLSSLSLYKTINAGVGGETIASIMARIGSIPFLIDESFIIPSSNTDKVKISLKSCIKNNDGSYRNVGVLAQGGSQQINPCYIDGIECTLSRVNNEYYINRYNNGESRTIPAGTIIITSYASIKPDILIIWIGTNDGTSYTSSQIIDVVNQCIKYYGTEKFLVLGLHLINIFGNTSSPNLEEIIQMNNDFRDEWGAKFIDERAYMSTNAIYDAIRLGYIDNSLAIYPTSNDISFMQRGYPPATLRADSTHYNATGNRILVNYINDRIKLLKY